MSSDSEAKVIIFICSPLFSEDDIDGLPPIADGEGNHVALSYSLICAVLPTSVQKVLGKLNSGLEDLESRKEEVVLEDGVYGERAINVPIVDSPFLDAIDRNYRRK